MRSRNAVWEASILSLLAAVCVFGGAVMLAAGHPIGGLALVIAGIGCAFAALRILYRGGM